MADVKFSELNALSATDVASDDVFAIVDTSATTSKKLTIDSLFGSIPVDAKIADTTDSSSNTTGALIVSGGVGIAKSVTIGADLTVHGDTTISGNLTFGDAASDQVTFTADIGSDLTPVANVTHDIGTDEFFWSNVYSNNITTTAYTQNSTSILMNTTNKMFFHDTGLSIQSATNGTLDIAADTILEITAPTMNVVSTTVDFDANVTIHSTFSANTTAALMGTTLPLYFRDTGLSLSSPADGTLDIAADTILEITAPTTNVIATTAVDFDTPAITANGTLTIGVDATGHDVKFFGDTTGKYWLWDEDADGVVLVGTSTITGASQQTGALTVGVNDTGHDVTFYGAAAGAMMMWDEDADSLLVRGATADAAGSSGTLVLQTAQVSVEDGDILGRIDFNAPLETQGSDAILAGASIWAEADATFTASVNNTELVFATATTTVAAEKMRLDSAGQLGINIATPASLLDVRGTVQVGVDDTGYDVQIFGDTASSVLLWDTSDDQLEFGNATMTMSDARTSGTATITGLTIDMYNKLDTGSSNDRIGAAISTYGDTNAYTIRDSVGIRAMSRQSTGAEVTRLNTPLHAVLDLANTAIANNSGTTLSGAYGMVIDHDDTIATRTGQPTAFISFGEMYVGGTASIETAYLFDIFPNGKTGDATYATAADIAFYDDATIIAAERDAVILNSTDGSPATDAGDLIVLETIDGDAYTPSRLLEESHTDVLAKDNIITEAHSDNIVLDSTDGTSDEGGLVLLEADTLAGLPDQYNYIVMEAEPDTTTPYIMLDTVGESAGILDSEGGKVIFEGGTQSADGTIKIRINGEDKYIQVYNTY